jgi:serine/threonine protein kinase
MTPPHPPVRAPRPHLGRTSAACPSQACDHPYVVPIHYSFQTPQFLYMVQEHVPNHTLARYLEKHEGKPMREEEVRFMTGQLVCALAHMHKQTIVYRDLKPANVLIDTEGHLRMVDMGMASKLDPETGRRKSVCGTQRRACTRCRRGCWAPPHAPPRASRYMAPEMKAKQPYEQSVDWFSLGKLILDCHGRDPYAKECAYWETSGAATARPPPSCAAGASSHLEAWTGLLELIDALLVKEPTNRRGYGPDGARHNTPSRPALSASRE